MDSWVIIVIPAYFWGLPVYFTLTWSGGLLIEVLDEWSCSNYLTLFESPCLFFLYNTKMATECKGYSRMMSSEWSRTQRSYSSGVWGQRMEFRHLFEAYFVWFEYNKVLLRPSAKQNSDDRISRLQICHLLHWNMLRTLCALWIRISGPSLGHAVRWLPSCKNNSWSLKILREVDVPVLIQGQQQWWKFSDNRAWLNNSANEQSIQIT